MKTVSPVPVDMLEAMEASIPWCWEETMKQVRRIFERSLRLRQVSAGGCNGCEAELAALGGHPEAIQPSFEPVTIKEQETDEKYEELLQHMNEKFASVMDE